MRREAIGANIRGENRRRSVLKSGIADLEVASRADPFPARLSLPVCSLRTWAAVFCCIFLALPLLAMAGAWWAMRDGPSAQLLAACLAIAAAACLGALLVARNLAAAFENIARSEDLAPALTHPVREIGELASKCRTTRDSLRLLNAARLDAEEAERRRLARELHDEVGQELALLRIWLQTLQKEGGDAASCLRLLHDSESLAGTIMEQVRSMALDLRPAQLDDLGLAAALRALVRRVGRQTGITATVLDLPDTDTRLPETVETALFRLAQAAVTNAVRHAHASTLWMALEVRDGEATLKVQDDGAGFDADAARRDALSGHGMGILVMQERVRALGGALDILSVPGTGTLVRATIPLVAACTT